MSAREFQEWQAFYQHEPFGEWRHDRRTAQLLALWANVYRDADKRAEPYTESDFMPEFWTETQETKTERTPEEWAALIVMLNAAYGGVDLRHGDSR